MGLHEKWLVFPYSFGIHRQITVKNPKYEILRKTVLWESRRSVWTDGQAEMMMPVDVVFFANTPKNYRISYGL